MIKDSGFTLTSLRVDGGMTANALLLQLQADIMGCDVCTLVPSQLSAGSTVRWVATVAPSVVMWLTPFRPLSQCARRMQRRQAGARPLPPQVPLALKCGPKAR